MQETINTDKTVTTVQPHWGIDWQQPWLADWFIVGEKAAALVAQGLAVHEALQTVCGQAAITPPVRFVPQDVLPAGQAYEQFIFETGSVPSRHNLHDFFNGLCWLQFPLTKKRLNQLQAAEIARAGVQQLRGPVRDALTVFDENAGFLLAPQQLWEALEARDWKTLFVALRPLWAEAQLVLFGHALLEKLVSPRKPIVVHVYRVSDAMNSVVNPGHENLAQLDAWVAADLTAGRLAGKPFLPLPVLGVPGWWPENANFCFYDDSHIFRPRR